MECGICNAIKKWFKKKGDKDDMTDLRSWLIMNDKEKIKKALQEIHDFKILYVEQLALFSCENSPRYERLLKEIVKTLT